jgi:hypothetical protein
MARVCLICSQTSRLTYERQYLQGIPISRIASALGVSDDCVRNHMSNHLSRQLSTAMAKKDLDNNTDMLSEIDQIIKDAKTIFKRNFDKGADLTALKALDSQRATLELLCKISAYLHQTKLLELQEKQSGESQEEESDFAEKIKILTIPELVMLQRIQKKIDSQDRKDIIIPENEGMAANTPMTRTNPPKRSFQEDKPVNRRNAALLSPLDGVQESWQPEPGKKYDWINGKAQKPVEDERKISMDDPKVLESIRRLNHGR